MKKLLCSILVFVAIFGSAFAQMPENIKKRYSNSFDVFTSIVTDKPENFDTKAINMGYSFSASYLIPISKSNLSFSVGAGFTFYNLYTDALPKDAIPVDKQKEEWGSDFYFKPLKDFVDGSYVKNKLVFSNFDIPVELFYTAKNGLRFTLGMKLSFNIGSHTKYKGYDFLYGTTDTYKYKKYDLKNLSSFGISPIVRFGWKWFNVYASYSFVPFYDAAAGSHIRPISIGISLMPVR